MYSIIGDGDRDDNKIDASPNGTLIMTWAKTQAAVQLTAIVNALEENLTLEMLYAAGVIRRVILNVIAELNFNSLPIALQSMIIMAEPTSFNSEGSNSLLLLRQTLHLSPRSSCPGMDLLRRIMSGHHNHLHHKNLTTTRTFYWLAPHMSMIRINRRMFSAGFLILEPQITLWTIR